MENQVKKGKAKRAKVSFKMPIKMLNGYKRYMLIAGIAMILGAIVAYMIPYISAFAVDYCIGQREDAVPGWIANLAASIGGRDFFIQNFYVLPLVIIALTLLNGLCTFLRGRNIAIAAEGFAKSTRDALYAHLQKMPYDYHKHVSTGDLIQRCTSDVDTIRRFITTQLLEVLRTITMIAVATMIMFSLNVKMARVSVVLLPILLVASYIYFKIVRKQFTASDEAEGKMSAVLQENFTGMRVVRAFAQQKNEVDKFTASNRDFCDKTLKLNKMLGLYWGMSDMLGYIQILLTLSMGVYLAATEGFTVGQVMMFTTYSSMLTWPVRQLGRVLSDFGKSTVSISRLDEVLNSPEEAETGAALTPAIDGDIVYKHVCFGYDKLDDVLSDISFTAKRGQTIAILGSTGSGKTSLVQLLQRLYTAKSGEITINGVNINDIDMHYLRSKVGMVLQEPYLYSRTIMENIRITNPGATDDEVYEAAKIASVHTVITEFEKGYDTLVGERGVTLSGGQKQRVAIARMLMQNAPILVFDDSLSAVDTETDLAIREALNRRRGASTTFIISHRITTLCHADLILVLDNGKLVQTGTHDELMKQDGLYRRVADIQYSANDLEGGDKQ